MRKPIMVVAIGLCLVVFLLSVSVAAGAAKVKLRLGEQSADKPFEFPTVAWVHVFKEAVERYSGGEIEVTPYWAGTLGGEQELLPQVMTGELELCVCSHTYASQTLGIPELAVLDIPYIFRSPVTMAKMLERDGPFMRKINEKFHQKGVHIELVPQTFRHITNSVRPIRTPTDLKGLKMRVMPIEHFKIMMESMGAQATPIPWVELYTSLQTGVADGQENPIANIVGAKLHEVQKYITLDGHCLWPTGWIMNWKWFKSLKPEHQKAIWMAMDEAKYAHIGIASLWNDVGIGTLKSAGVQIYTPTEKELEAFRKATQQPVINYLITKKGISKEYIDWFFAELTKIERELGY